MSNKNEKYCKFCQKNAKIRDVKILKDIPLHIKTIQSPIVKP